MDFFEILKAIILGIIEGITEWLPISSTGHMILVDTFLKLNMSEEFKEMFMVVIQLGAILSVVVLYFKKLFPFHFNKKPYADKDTFSLWFKIILAVLPAALIGIPFDDKIDSLFYNYQTVTVTLVVYGILFLVIEKFHREEKVQIRNIKDISFPIALGIGICQVLSLIPGTSRSGVTILGAMLLGTSRTVAAEFTFFLAIPVMFGASLIKLLKFGLSFTSGELIILATGMITAFVVSILAIKFLMGYIKKHDFKVFGIYRILLGALVFIYFSIFA